MLLSALLRLDVWGVGKGVSSSPHCWCSHGDAIYDFLLVTNGIKKWLRELLQKLFIKTFRVFSTDVVCTDFDLIELLLIVLSAVMPPKPRNTDNQTTSRVRPNAGATSPAQCDPVGPPPHDGDGVDTASTVTASSMASVDFKAERLVALREEMVGIFKSELQMAMTENLSQIKSELQSVKTELTATKSDVGELRGTVIEMEESLSTCTDDVAYLKSKVESLSNKVLALENKCEDLEGRSRCNNIRIIGLSEQCGTVTAASTSVLLKEALNLDKALLLTMLIDP